MRPRSSRTRSRLRARVEAGEIAGPRILTAGGALFPKDGIPIYLRDLPPEFLASLSQPGTRRGGARGRAGEPRRRRGRDQAFPHDAAGRRPLRVHAARHRARRRGRDASPQPPGARAPDRHRGHQPRDRGGRGRARAHDDRRGQDRLGSAAHRADALEEHGPRADAAALSVRAEAGRARAADRRLRDGRCRRAAARVFEARAARCSSAPTSAT